MSPGSPRADGVNILLPPAIYLALALLLAVLLGRRLRAMQPPAADSDLDAPYELFSEPLTQAEADAVWARIEAAIAEERRDAA